MALVLEVVLLEVELGMRQSGGRRTPGSGSRQLARALHLRHSIDCCCRWRCRWCCWLCSSATTDGSSRAGGLGELASGLWYPSERAVARQTTEDPRSGAATGRIAAAQKAVCQQSNRERGGSSDRLALWRKTL